MTHVHDEACAASSEANDRYLRCHFVGDVLVAIYTIVWRLTSWVVACHFGTSVQK
jgi:hypothetical protein